MRNIENGGANNEASAVGGGGVGVAAGLSVGVGAASGGSALFGQGKIDNEFVRRTRSKGSAGVGDAIIGINHDDDVGGATEGGALGGHDSNGNDVNDDDTSEGWSDNVCDEGVCELPCDGEDCGCICHHDH